MSCVPPAGAAVCVADLKEILSAGRGMMSGRNGAEISQRTVEKLLAFLDRLPAIMTVRQQKVIVLVCAHIFVLSPPVLMYLFE